MGVFVSTGAAPQTACAVARSGTVLRKIVAQNAVNIESRLIVPWSAPDPLDCGWLLGSKMIAVALSYRGLNVDPTRRSCVRLLLVAWVTAVLVVPITAWAANLGQSTTDDVRQHLDGLRRHEG